MPRGDRTGPRGSGPLTGRGLGYCAGYASPGFVRGSFGLGFGFRRGMGLGWGRGFGRGYRYQYPLIDLPVIPAYQTIVPNQLKVPYGSSVPYYPTIIPKEEQLRILKNQKDNLEKELAYLNEEIDKIEEEK